VDDCPTKELLDRVFRNCGTEESCAMELREQKKLIVPTDAAEKIASVMKKGELDHTFGTQALNSNRDLENPQRVKDRNELMRIPRDFDQLVQELSGETRAKGDIIGVGRYVGNYTFRSFVAYHSGNRLLKHLKACLETCTLVGDSCRAIFEPEVGRVEQQLASLQLRPFWDEPFHMSELRRVAEFGRRYFDGTFGRRTCPGLKESEMHGASSCLEYLTKMGVEPSDSAGTQLIEKLFRTMERVEPVPGTLERILKVSRAKSPTCFFEACPEQVGYFDTVVESLWGKLYNLTAAEVAVLENDCLHCWQDCLTKCKAAMLGVFHEFALRNVEFSSLAYVSHLCNSSKCADTTMKAFRNEPRLLGFGVLVQQGTFTELPQKLDVVLALIVSVLAIFGAIILAFFGGKAWRDFKIGLYILVAVGSWSILRMVSLAVFTSAHSVTVVVGGASSFRYEVEGPLRLVGSSQLLSFWVDYIVVVVQSGLLSLLLYQWLAALLSDAKYAKLRKVLKICFMIVVAGLMVAGLGIMIYFTLDPAGSESVNGEFETTQGISRWERLMLWFMIAFSYILLVLLAAIVCCVLGLVVFRLEGHNKNAVVKSLIIFVLLTCGFGLRSMMYFSLAYRFRITYTAIHAFIYNGNYLFSLQLVLGEILIAFPLLVLAFLGIYSKAKQARSSLAEGDRSTSLLNRNSEDTEMSVPSQYRDF
jgi:hypothetical protein